MIRKVTVTPLLFVQFLFISTSVSSQATDSLHQEASRSEIAAEKNLSAHRTAIRALEQASIGGPAGLLIGQQMDQQAEALKQIVRGGTIDRVAEGILITLPSTSLFEADSFEPLPAARVRFRNLAKMMNKFPYSCMLIEVHTDGTGEEIYSRALSDKRAKSLETLLTRDGVNNSRLLARGYGDKQPLSLNTPADERHVNRRVELILLANDEMKAMARKGEIGEFFAARK